MEATFSVAEAQRIGAHLVANGGTFESSAKAVFPDRFTPPGRKARRGMRVWVGTGTYRVPVVIANKQPKANSLRAWEPGTIRSTVSDPVLRSFLLVDLFHKDGAPVTGLY